VTTIHVKDDIFSALASFIGDSVMGNAATIAASSRKPLEKLETIFFSHIRVITEFPGIPRFIFSEDVHISHPEVATTLKTRIGSYIETVSGVVAAALSEGAIRPGTSPRETAVTMLGMIQFTALRNTIDGHNCNIASESRKLWDNFLHLIC
jgi:AcrR family transcriptional regulator